VVKRDSARPYARAVFEMAREAGTLDQWQADLSRVAGLREDPQLAAFLDSPRFPFEDKARLIQVKLGDARPQALNLAYLLTARGKLAQIEEINHLYLKMKQGFLGIKTARVITATPLSETGRDTLAAQLGKLLGSQVLLSEMKVDPGLIGGIVIRVDGKLLDGSTSSWLAALNQKMVNAE